jgi:radical SAM protein (TIGR01212 family)
MRYRAIGPYLRSIFGKKVFKVSIEIPVTCPNRDGTKGVGGCIFCNPLSGRALVGGDHLSVREQLLKGIDYIKKRHGAEAFISYFHQHTNTYGDAKVLGGYFYDALDHPEVVGLAISTRPDAISDDILHLLSDLNKKRFMWVELGLQTANNRMLEFLNRGHTVEEFEDAAARLHAYGIMTVAHVIIGLPGEREEDLLNTASLLNRLGVWGVKIHNLHILRDTPLEEMYKRGEIQVIGLEEYAERTVFFLEHLKGEIVIHRFNSHSPRHLTVAPAWSVNKLGTFNAVSALLEKKGSWQGKALGEPMKYP